MSTPSQLRLEPPDRKLEIDKHPVEPRFPRGSVPRTPYPTLKSSQGETVYDNGGLNLAHLTDEQQIEVEDDDHICVRRVSEGEQAGRQRRIGRSGDE